MTLAHLPACRGARSPFPNFAFGLTLFFPRKSVPVSQLLCWEGGGREVKPQGMEGTSGEAPPGLGAEGLPPSLWPSTPVYMLMTSKSIPPAQTQGPSAPQHQKLNGPNLASLSSPRPSFLLPVPTWFPTSTWACPGHSLVT